MAELEPEGVYDIRGVVVWDAAGEDGCELPLESFVRAYLEGKR